MRCVSFCTADNYKLAAISAFFKSQGYAVKQYRKVLHLVLPAKKIDIFVFSYGCLVIWGMKRAEEKKFLQQIEPFAINPLANIECDYFIFRYGEKTEMTTHERFNADIITLESESISIKLAISYGLAQSIQLESYETAVQKTIDENSHYPEQLAQKGKIGLSEKEISKRMGKIFLSRSSINLNSDYLEGPEYFWEFPTLESYYNISQKFLDVPRRVSALNQKLDVLHDLFGVLTEQLAHQHSSMLELIIILLIVIEIIISVILYIAP